MRRSIWRTLFRVLAGALLVGGTSIYLLLFNQTRLAIDASRGISEATFVSIGGIDQWIQIRGEDRDNPVLLWLNGGPGASMIPATPVLRPFEKNFTVVLWDQRGEGRTFQRSGRAVAPTMTIERMARDGIEVAEYLRDHLHKGKIILLGHSWGSILGIHMIKARPNLFHAYVGTGQVANLRQGVEIGYPQALAKARAAGNAKAVSELEAVGPPPYADIQKYFVPLVWENRLDQSPSLLVRVAMAMESVFQPYLAEGAEFSQGVMLGPMLDADLPMIASRFDIPVFFFQGADDIITPTELAREYFDHLEAPKKEFVQFPDAGHLAVLYARDAFVRELEVRVRPLATR